jgi:L-ascorbate metabolism protein UlaG (beta-lactamase superfamily)
MRSYPLAIATTAAALLPGLAALSAVPPVPPATLPASAPLTVTLVANEGFLVEGGGRKVLIDALFTGPAEGLQVPPPAVLDRLRGGRTPFDGVDLVLVTHHHPDHFDAALVLAFLEGSARAHLVAPPSAVGEMAKDTARYAKVRDRVVVADSARGGRPVNVNGIPVRPIRVSHSGDDQAGVDNVMYVFSLGGRTFFHEGDATDDPRAFASVAGPEGVDIAFLHGWFLMAPDGNRILRDSVRPRTIFVMHVPLRLREDAVGKMEMLRSDFPGLVYLKEPLDSWKGS